MRRTLEKTTLRGLLEALAAHLPKAYPGGSNKTDLERFKTYLHQKSFALCLWTRTDNARMAENRLLRMCEDLGCQYNVQRRSGLRAAPGFVYVLI